MKEMNEITEKMKVKEKEIDRNSKRLSSPRPQKVDDNRKIIDDLRKEKIFA